MNNYYFQRFLLEGQINYARDLLKHHSVNILLNDDNLSTLLSKIDVNFFKKKIINILLRNYYKKCQIFWIWEKLIHIQLFNFKKNGKNGVIIYSNFFI